MKDFFVQIKQIHSYSKLKKDPLEGISNNAFKQVFLYYGIISQSQ